MKSPRKEAKEKGLKTYISKTQCKYCGSFEKYVSTYNCVPCGRKRSLKILDDSVRMAPYRTKEKRLKSIKSWRKNNPEKVKLQQERQKYKVSEYYQKNKDVFYERICLSKYGLTLNDYYNILKKQNNKCAICETDKPGGQGRFHLDHCHKTNKVRGLLCHRCNTSLGGFRDDPIILERAKIYLCVSQ